MGLISQSLARMECSERRPSAGRDELVDQYDALMPAILMFGWFNSIYMKVCADHVVRLGAKLSTGRTTGSGRLPPLGRRLLRSLKLIFYFG